jgi:hypothetical protein
MTELLTKEEADGMKLIEREDLLRSRGCLPVQPEYSIVWEDPTELDSPVKVTTPSPNWLGYAMHGNFMPDITVYIRDKRVQAQWIKDNPGKSFSWKEAGGAKHPYAETIGAMTQEECMEYILQKDVPEYVWNDKTGNKPRFTICRRSMIPVDRTYRNAWKLVIDEEDLAA